MTQVLHLTNGKTIQEKIEAKEGRITQLLSTSASSAEIIDTAYLAALSRHPTDLELSRLSAIIDQTVDSEKRLAVEDLFWSILTSKEFLFQH